MRLYGLTLIALLLSLSSFAQKPPRVFTHNDTLMAMGTNLYRNHEFSMAKIILDSCILQNPSNDECIYYRGKVAYDEGDYQTAENAFKGVLALVPTDYTAWNLLGLTFQQLKHYDSAEHCFKNAVKLNSKESELYANWGKNEYLKKNYVHAEQLYETAIFLNPNNSHYYNNRAVVKKAMGNLAGADSDLMQSLAIDPNDTLAKKQLEQKGSIANNSKFWIILLGIIVFVIAMYEYSKRVKKWKKTS